MSTAMLAYQAAIEAAKEARKQATAHAKTAFEDASKELFAEYPNLHSFGWTQYTPYFNDGDPCVFRVSTEWPTVHLTGDDESDWDENYNSSIPEHKAVRDFLAQFEDDDLNTMFGDGMRVMVDRERGIETDEYDHD